MSKTHSLRVFLAARLTAAAEEIFGAVEQTMVEYQEEVSRSEREVERLQSLLDILLKPDIKLHRVAGELVQQATVPGPEADLAPEQRCCGPEWSSGQWWRPGLDQGDPGPETTQIKEELGPLSISEGAEELQAGAIVRFIMTPHLLACLAPAPSSHLHPPRLGDHDTRTDVVSLTTGPSVAELSEAEPCGEDYTVSVATTVAPPVASSPSKPPWGVNAQQQQSPVATQGHASTEATPLVPPAPPRGIDASFPRCCKLCGMSFRSVAPLAAHVLTHTGGDGERLCGVCGLRLASAENMAAHLQAHLGAEAGLHGDGVWAPPPAAAVACHPGLKAFRCPVCGKAFATSDEMTVHERVHTGERPYRCQVCGKGFAQGTSLKVHMQHHSGERRHRCHVCSKSFCASNHLTAHMMTHTGEKPYLCSCCGKGFIWSEDLKKHMRIHTGERPYRCLFCDKAFTQNGNLRAHMKRTHAAETVLQAL